MPISEEMMRMVTASSSGNQNNSDANQQIDYKQKYSSLKRKLKLLIYENECYQEELRKSQRQLLQVNRDKTYLLDRLLQYENIQSTTSDSDETVSSESEVETKPKPDHSKKKKPAETETKDTGEKEKQSSSGKNKKRASNSTGTSGKSTRNQTSGKPNNKATMVSTAVTIPTITTIPVSTQSLPITITTSESLKPKPLPSFNQFQVISAPVTTSQATQASVDLTTLLGNSNEGHMTKEELERHLESRRNHQLSSLLMNEKTLLTVPVELFSNESSNGLPDDDALIS